MTTTRNIVRVTNVTKTFQLGKIAVHALKGVDLEIATGQYVSIMGPSGSGKSTLFNMIGGLDKPSTGKVSTSTRSIFPSWTPTNWPGCAAVRSAIFSRLSISSRS
jgi:ABC-type Fe3+/spermidine/putrescine transport system ATPase subunit